MRKSPREIADGLAKQHESPFVDERRFNRWRLEIESNLTEYGNARFEEGRDAGLEEAAKLASEFKHQLSPNLSLPEEIHALKSSKGGK